MRILTELPSRKPGKAFSVSDLIPFLGLILVAIVLYQPLFMGEEVMPDTWERFEPWNTDLGFNGPMDPRIECANNDAILLYIPWNKIAHDRLQQGKIPAWDPYCLGGTPLAANHLVPVFYPVYALIAFLFAPLMIMGVSGLVHTFILGFFFYLFLRELTGSRLASWLAAGFLMISLLPNPHYQPWPMTMAWFPTIWFFYERWLKHRSPWAGLWIAVCWSFPMLSGYPSLFFQLSLFTALWFIIRPGITGEKDIPKISARLGILILPFILALGLSAVQNAPTLLASAESDRSIFKSATELDAEAAFTLGSATPWQTHAKRLFQPALPFKFLKNDFFNRGYIGAIPVMFAVFGLMALRRREYPRKLLLLACLIGPFALIPALNFLVYRYTAGVFIDPNPPLEVFGLIVLMLSAFGIKYWIELLHDDTRTFERKRGMLIAVLTGFAILVVAAGVRLESFITGFREGVWPIVGTAFVAFPLSEKDPRVASISKAVAVIVILFLGFFYGAKVLTPVHGDETDEEGIPMPWTTTLSEFHNFVDPEYGGEWGRVIRYSPEPFNVMSIDNQPYFFYPNLGTYFEIPDAFGYHNLAPGVSFDFLRAVQGSAVIERRGIVAFTGDPESEQLPWHETGDNYYNTAFNNLIARGVRYVITDKVIPGYRPLVSNANFYVYKDILGAYINSAGIPESRAAQRVYTVPYVFEGTESDETSLAPVQPGMQYSDLARSSNPPKIILDVPGRMVIETANEIPVALFLNETYVSGWTANVDSNRAELLNEPVRGMYVILESGSHTVEFSYEMPGLLTGAGITIASCILWLLLALAFTIKRTKSVHY